MPEPVDGLLAISNDEDRRRRVADSLAFAPRIDQQLDEPPLQAARVLEFVDEHVVVAGLQLQPAPRELFLLREQRHGLVEHPGKVEERVFLEQRFIQAGCDGQQAKNAARKQGIHAGLEALERVLDVRRQRDERLLVLILGELRFEQRHLEAGLEPRRSLAGEETALEAPPQLLDPRHRGAGQLIQ
jgi:hypothetical protein